MNIGDYKDCRPQSERPMMNFCLGLIALIGALTAYFLTTDIPKRQVVARSVTMTEDELRGLIAKHRIDAARKVMEAQRCDRLQDQFRWTPQKQRQPM